MADFVSGFWNGYVMFIIAGSLAYCVFVLIANHKVDRGHALNQLHGHVWDENLAEYNNPLPRWWMYLFWITIVFAIVYLTLYPGFGNYKGLAGWSSHGQYDAEVAKADAKYAPIFNKYKEMDLAAVAADPEAKAMGGRLFLTYCAQCHGSDAKGAMGFPNLTDNDWLYGGEAEAIQTTISEGREGVMPPWGPVLGADGVKDVANYVRSLSGLANDSLRTQRGEELFATNCAACHGADGTGNQMIGAPNLADKTWLYGSSEATIIDTVANGKTNRMPTFQAFLGDAKIHLLAAYVYGLSQKDMAAK
jgi:cytochrome c oxidase cbb3-type subunit 3